MIEYKPAGAWRGPGAPKVVIPQEVQDALERTYRHGECGELRVERDSEECEQLIRLMRIYATRRRNKVFDHQFFDLADGGTGLRFRMRDPRAYRAATVSRVRR